MGSYVFARSVCRRVRELRDIFIPQILENGMFGRYCPVTRRCERSEAIQRSSVVSQKVTRLLRYAHKVEGWHSYEYVD